MMWCKFTKTLLCDLALHSWRFLKDALSVIFTFFLGLCNFHLTLIVLKIVLNLELVETNIHSLANQEMIS